MRNREQGFTLVEMIVATGLLAVAVAGLATAIPVAMISNNRNRIDSEASMLAERELEQISAQVLSATSFVDASGNTVSLAPGGSTLTGGKIDFAAAAVAGYNATLVGGAGSLYELRWNVQALADGSKQFTVAVRRKSTERYLPPPVNLSLRLGR